MKIHVAKNIVDILHICSYVKNYGQIIGAAVTYKIVTWLDQIESKLEQKEFSQASVKENPRYEMKREYIFNNL